FMNSVTAAFPNRKLHVILDNLNTHKKNEDWLKAHPNAPRVTSNSSGCGQSNSSTREAGQGTVSLSLFPGQEL
ncbi:hypothetical protein QJT78_52815, partial [Bradyrhizobium sp. Mp27]|nr:hypothetical protein [Bradyrhizobium sp. Mp27]